MDASRIFLMALSLFFFNAHAFGACVSYGEHSEQQLATQIREFLENAATQDLVNDNENADLEAATHELLDLTAHLRGAVGNNNPHRDRAFFQYPFYPEDETGSLSPRSVSTNSSSEKQLRKDNERKEFFQAKQQLAQQNHPNKPTGAISCFEGLIACLKDWCIAIDQACDEEKTKSP